jgi:hypothetical protein
MLLFLGVVSQAQTEAVAQPVAAFDNTGLSRRPAGCQAFLADVRVAVAGTPVGSEGGQRLFPAALAADLCFGSTCHQRPRLAWMLRFISYGLTNECLNCSVGQVE